MPQLNPRGLRRADAAAYIGISPTLFDKKRREGLIPAPRELFGVMIWDRADLDKLFDRSEGADQMSSYWDKKYGVASA